ncbi:uncharacterized protein BCR38DRAFT_461967 [Pseudomassariella vexata]|uniref:Uncharacterized protein n=1 Tax=Pseudomassariella vexata TaxID=1141098 RepID=A0A1Y2D852_9PEZI|nr:uncharacterized protein BCR38DRAFT_461967 [Pseudomassariella vexata]ORY55448.1 hypothetical protein BCR38DRAFT_461967 [Pseudomassariella vexata]
MGYRILHRSWRSIRAMWFVMVAELAGTVAVLVLFGIAQPDLFRTQLWQAGDDLGFNSSPNIILYAYANHDPLPKIPFVWSPTLTNFNVAISVISLFVLITKMICVIMHVWFPLVALFFNVSLTALYATSIYGQAGPDYVNPDRPSPVAWYIAKSCDVAANQSVQKSCKTAKGTFAITVIMMSIYLVNLGLTIWALLPSANDKKSNNADSDDEESSPSSFTKNDKWEMHGMPQTPRTGSVPFTPRTMAFNALERKLPLRSQYA